MKKKPYIVASLISLLFILSLWGFGLGRTQAMASFSNSDPVTIISAFQELQVKGGNCKLEYIGRWQDGIYTSLEKQDFLKSLAEHLNITDGYTLNESSTDTKDRVDLYKPGKNAYTMLSVVTDKTHKINYLLIKIDFTELTDSAVYYKSQLQKLLKENQVDGNVTLVMGGYYEGELTREQKNQLSDYFFKKMDGKTVENGNLEELYSIYGYTRRIPEYLMINGNKMNLNLAISYDEVKNQTNIHAATPLLKEDY